MQGGAMTVCFFGPRWVVPIIDLFDKDIRDGAIEFRPSRFAKADRFLVVVEFTCPRTEHGDLRGDGISGAESGFIGFGNKNAAAGRDRDTLGKSEVDGGGESPGVFRVIGVEQGRGAA